MSSEGSHTETGEGTRDDRNEENGAHERAGRRHARFIGSRSRSLKPLPVTGDVNTPPRNRCGALIHRELAESFNCELTDATSSRVPFRTGHTYHWYVPFGSEPIGRAAESARVRR
jgi:hypothetical protein